MSKSDQDSGDEHVDPAAPLFSRAALLRNDWADALLDLEAAAALAKEVRQMIIDAMDVAEQTNTGDRLAAALRAFDGKSEANDWEAM